MILEFLLGEQFWRQMHFGDFSGFISVSLAHKISVSSPPASLGIVHSPLSLITWIEECHPQAKATSQEAHDYYIWLNSTLIHPHRHMRYSMIPVFYAQAVLKENIPISTIAEGKHCCIQVKANKKPLCSNPKSYTNTKINEEEGVK